MFRIPELLALAGGMEQLKAAVENGADAVYTAGNCREISSPICSETNLLMRKEELKNAGINCFRIYAE
ncbi:MAG: hypothetical protein PHC91_11490 [Eubacteriales bacterium]|nr:hypothetical protein [Eubacteriales bacterium]